MADKEHHARLVVHDLDTMSDADHAKLINWANKLVQFLRVTPRKDFSKRFTSRCFK